MSPIDTGYQGLLFPDRAESLRDADYRGYRVFLDFWAPLSAQLRLFYEGLVIRRDTRALLVFGPQGGGKTMFARKLASDFESTPPVGALRPDKENLWHRIAGADRLDAQLIQQWRAQTTIVNITNDTSVPGTRVSANESWITNLIQMIRPEQGRRWIVIADNAEQGYFVQGLLGLSDAQFIAAQGGSPQARTELAAQRFVMFARNELRSSLFIVLTNNNSFAHALESGVNDQHQGMLARENLPLPGSQEKETVVRVNINRLNPLSYWSCLDRAGPTEKVEVYRALSGASTFPASFAAVNNAIQSSGRQGRRASSCLLSLIILTGTEIGHSDIVSQIGGVWRREVDYQWLSSTLLDERWAQATLPMLDAKLLESEWMLRVVVLGGPFVRALLSGDRAIMHHCSNLLEQLKTSAASRPGTWGTTIDNAERDLRAMVDAWPDTSAIDTRAFWSLGQRRSGTYEPLLRSLLGQFDVGGPGFLGYRPDYIVTPFTPCSVLSAAAENSDAINRAIRQNAHVFEFTAIDALSEVTIRSYLTLKLSNYVEITREQ
jgi:hypothetical protein